MLSHSNFHIIVTYIKDFFHASDILSVSTLTDLHSETFFQITVYFIAFFYLEGITIKKLSYDLEQQEDLNFRLLEPHSCQTPTFAENSRMVNPCFYERASKQPFIIICFQKGYIVRIVYKFEVYLWLVGSIAMLKKWLFDKAQIQASEF